MAADLAAAAGEPDGGRALRRMLRGQEQEVGDPDPRAVRARRSEELTVENLLREIDSQREVLRERTRLLERERSRLRRITESRMYRVYQRLRGLPGVRQLAARRDAGSGPRLPALAPSGDLAHPAARAAAGWRPGTCGFP